MKIIIIYASNHGTTEKVSRYIAEKIKYAAVDLCPVSDINPTNLSLYDCIIIGASVHAGSVQRSIRKFTSTNTELLLSKPLALFLCGMNKHEFILQFEKAFPETLRNHAISKKSISGEFLFEKMNVFEKTIIKKITGVKESISDIDYKKADELIKEIEDLFFG